MKKLLVSVLAIAGLVACSQEQTLVQSNNSGTLMEFNVAALDNATRVDPSITTETLKGFDVWAFVEDETGTVLGGLDANDKNGGENVELSNGKWGYTNVQYWTPGHDYYFTAIAPMDSDNWSYSLNGVDTGADNTIDFKNIDGTEDLIYAHKVVTTPDKFDQPMAAVGLQFEHLLSKVRFTFKNEFTTNNVHFVIEDVKMVVPAEGTYSTENGTWADLGGETTLEFGDVEKMSMGQSKTAADERFTIPAAANASYDVTFTLKHYNGDVLVNTYYKESTITGVVFEKGKAYNMVAGFNPENLDLQAIDFELEGVNGWVEVVEANDAADIQRVINEAEGEVEIVLTGDISLDELLDAGTLSTRAGSSSASITIPAGKEVVLDIKDYTITATDNETGHYGMFNIAPDAKLTIEGGNDGKIQLIAKNNRGWNAYSSVISNQRGTFVLNGGTIEHLGGTDMAYGIDNLTNTGAGDAKTTINDGVVKSTYRAVRLFLNSTKALDEVVVTGGTIEGANKSIWVQNANANVNPGKLVVADAANLNGDVMVSGSNASALAIELSVAEAALKNGSTVVPSNLPAGYDVVVKDGNWVVEYGVEVDGDEISVSNAGGLKWVAQQVNGGDTFEGKTVVLTADIDLNNENWTPIGYWTTFNGTFDGNNHTISNLKHHGTEEDCYVGLFGYTENATIKNLTINNVDLKLVANSSWAGGHMGALVGNIEGETVIENITVTGDVKIDGNVEMAGAGRIGGVVGGNVAKVSFKDVVVNANKGSFVQGNSSIGGIAGQLQGETTFVNCSSNIDVTAQQFYAGGIIGLAYRITSFENCSASGNISVLAGRSGNNNDFYRVGGIAGGWDEDDNGEYILPLVNCSTTCVLTGKSADGRTATAFDCGGFVGRGYGAKVGAMVSVNGTVYEYAGEGVYKIGDSYVVNTGDALVAALAKKYNVTFGKDLKIDPANMSNAYGKTGVLVYEGQTIDGAGYKLDVQGAGGTWDSGICTSGGLIKNLWVTGSFRGVFVKGATHVEKVVLENVRIEGTTYTISIDQASGQGLEATNSIFRGWTSYAATIGNVKFDGCTFGAGNGYNFSRPYAPTTYVNCDFEAGHAIDPRAAVSFENCRFNGVALTSENIATLVTSNVQNVVEVK